MSFDTRLTEWRLRQLQQERRNPPRVAPRSKSQGLQIGNARKTVIARAKRYVHSARVPDPELLDAVRTLETLEWKT